VNVRQLPVSWVLVHPPDQLTLRRRAPAFCEFVWLVT
jgi:hypothetical protein